MSLNKNSFFVFEDFHCCNDNLLSSEERICLIKSTTFYSTLAVILSPVRELLSPHIKFDFIPILLYVLHGYCFHLE